MSRAPIASSVESCSDDAEAPAPEAVEAALQRLLASPAFAATERLKSFLRFVVGETLAGRASRIKAFTVAVEVFGRDESFDPQNDPVVRLEAGRLRRALDHYYLTAGQSDPVRIDIPRGVCGRPGGCKRNLRLGRHVVRCCRVFGLLMRLHTRRGPVWRCADQVQFGYARSRRRPLQLVFPIPSR